MAALLTAPKITALETRITALTTLDQELRDELNALFAADPNGSKAHAAWRPLSEGHKAVREAALKLRQTIMANEDDYGK